MPIHKKHLSDSYKEMATRIFNEITGSNFEFEFLLKDEIDDDNSSNVQKEPPIEEVGVPYNNPIASNLKPNYTFDTFIVGNSNKFAHAAALSVAENPGKMYNPLFIYGTSGLGKTHLMHAIGNYIVQNSNKKVLYVTCEQFRDDFIGISRRMEENGNNFDYVDYRCAALLVVLSHSQNWLDELGKRHRAYATRIWQAAFKRSIFN